MRKIYTLIVLLFIINYVSKAQDVSIPEGAFKDFLMTKYPECFVNVDLDGHLMLNTACTSVTTEDSLEFHNLSTGGEPLNLEGIQYFTSLKFMNCSSNSILNSPGLPASLEHLNFSNA